MLVEVRVNTDGTTTQTSSGRGEFNVLEYGASTANTTAQNKTALQAAIAACDAAGGGMVANPWPIDYGYVPTDLATHPDFSGVVNDMMVLDHGPAGVGYSSEGAKQGWMEKRWYHTPPTAISGQHDGNGFRVLGDWHPYIWVDANPPVIALGSRPADYNYRTSLYFGLRGAAVYQMQMGNGVGDVSDNLLKGLNWIAYNDDGSFRHALMSFDYGTGRLGYGVSTTEPLSNHQFRMQDTTASTAMFQSQTLTNLIFFRNSEGAASDCYLNHTAGGGFGIGRAGVGDFITWDTSRHAVTGGNLTVNGALSKTSGTFDIPHPDPAKTETHRLRHSFVESPTRGDNIYRFTVDAPFSDDPATIEIPLPDYWQHLNENPQVWASSDGHFGQAFGKVNEDGTAIILTYDGTPGAYNVLLIGTRCDEIAKANFDPLGIEYEKGPA